jgi:hypothetical protein
MPNSSLCIWTSSWFFSIPQGLHFKTEGLANIQVWGMGQRSQKT